MADTATLAYLALARENEELRHRLQEAEDLIHAVRTGAADALAIQSPDGPRIVTLQEAEDLIEAVRTGGVDALTIQSPDGPRIFTLQGADESYRTLIEQMNEGAMLLHQDGTILYCNACLAGWLGRGLEEVIGHSFARFVPLAFQPRWASLLAQGWAGDGKGELPLQAKDGALRPLSLSMNVLSFHDAPVVAAIVNDLSAQREIKHIQALVTQQNAVIARKNEEIELQEAARLVVEQAAAEARRLLEGIPQIAWTASPDGQNTFLNARWMDYVEPQRDRSVSEWLLAAIHPDDVEVTGQAWARSLQTGQPLEVECRIRSAAGLYRWMLGRALPSRDEQGNIMQWIGTYTDIHEHKLALERIDHTQRLLQENNAQLTRVNADLDNFIYTASHDLKAPITNIEGLLHALRSELPDGGGSVQPIMHMMQDSVDRFKRTIEHLTDITKVQKEIGQPAAPVDLARLIEEVRLDLLPQIREAKARLVVEVGTFPLVSFAEKNLRSIVYNLLSNALKYRAPERVPHIQVRCQPAGEYALLTVQDNGLGMRLTSDVKLFGMFERLHDHVEGSGIGLYIVKKIVENAGGRIEVVSEVGVGSTFSIYFKR